MNAHYSPHFIAKYKKIAKRNKKLSDQIKEKIAQFLRDKNNASLNLHKLKGSMDDSWSFSIESNIRVILMYSGDTIIFTDIGSHDEVYK